MKCIKIVKWQLFNFLSKDLSVPLHLPQPLKH